ncbi:BAHD acyltransferase At5g47980-like [Phalaenopsis equestris]|uniref:BAHD acyltransferase At5g47980-like n=1 Tax=Phalaenopsis equestris TaxID=78828 RepID=UPI0009E54FE6|nr:BAHD acyltransferase At5g47980-like [Phalaenopsis equestris]
MARTDLPSSVVSGRERREIMRKMGVATVSVSRSPVVSSRRWLWAKPVGGVHQRGFWERWELWAKSGEGEDVGEEEMYSPILLCYSTTSTTALQELPWKLKTSLSKQPDGILQVNCNNEGAVFIEASSETDLTTFLLSPPINRFKELLPVKTRIFRHSEPILLLQFTKFLNGYVLGFSISHVIADAASMALFLNCWAETARGIEEDRIAMPCFTSASTLFPPKPLTIAYQEPEEPLENSELVAKRFVLSSSSIKRLRESAYKRSDQMRPTRVEAVTTLVIRSVMRSTASEEVGKVLLSQLVNLRKRFTGLSDLSIGNLWSVGVSFIEGGVGQEEVEKLLRESVRGVNEEGVRNGAERTFAGKNEGKGEGDWKGRMKERPWIFSSWCRMGFYKTDFGWGEPEWIGSGFRGMKDACLLIDGKDGEGIELWLGMEREEMQRLENDEEFLSFACA